MQGGAGRGGRGDCVKIPGPVAIARDFWTGRHVLVTGHTGFKGAWLCLWLQSLGAHVTGLSASVPTSPSLYQLARVGEAMRAARVDVRDASAVCAAIADAAPEVVVHMAAQPMVRRSLRDPAETYAVNVMGTVNVLEGVRSAGRSVRVVVVVTSDKCYENRGEQGRRFVETDPLGGEDPYSSSKACTELLSASYRSSFFGGASSPALATARAGNVIGGGDWGEDRLVPDMVRAAESASTMRVRRPDAVRPWQHVLSPLGGYLQLAQELWSSHEVARAWNFGPRAGDERAVRWVVERFAQLWGPPFRWELDTSPSPPEAGHLSLDSSSAERELGWAPACDLGEALRLVVDWHRALRQGADMREVSLRQVAQLG
jgi:CDP-glucose 4,6-dehydratase